MTTLYDPVKDRLLLFGGWAADHFVNDVWQLNLSGIPVWSQVPTTGGGPTPRRHYAAVYDASANRIVLTGGLDGSGYKSDTWTLTFDGAGNGTWAQQTPVAVPPSPRDGHRAVYDAANNRMLVYGGYDGLYRGDLWELHLGGAMSWELVGGGKSIQPGTRLLHTAILQASPSRMIVFGGLNSAGAKNDVWSFDASVSAAATGSSYHPSGQEAGASDGIHYQLGIAGVAPNPARGPFNIRFSLADARPARLSVFSISGRELLRREVGALGAGEHTIDLSAGGMAPGVYLVRLRGVDHTADAKVVIAGRQ